MALKDKVEEVKEKGSEALKKGETAFNKVKKKVYKGMATLEQQVEERKGIGKVIAGAGDVVDDIVERAKEADKDIKKKGGYGAMAKRGADAVKKTAEDVYGKLAGTYNKFKATVTTKGKYDPNKAKELLKDQAKATAEFGEKAVKSLAQMVKEGFGKLGEDYRKMVPSREERATTYADIGAEYKGVLLRENFEKCLAYHEKVRKALPGRLAGRQAFLNDIKASASSNPKELMEFYKQSKTTESEGMLKKVKQHIKYFK
ncbi:hypothetical protein AYK26_05895 [Euryarchaeota archaeon SM23-78]|nr:MAG: hypothetical protein AYK26_05895 [Euryarchaeota archaeon SM23-78]MBW3001343.1 hypothetical protein [Candidatus Woesearchaeota archaeon]